MRPFVCEQYKLIWNSLFCADQSWALQVQVHSSPPISFSILASPPNRLTPNLTKTTKTQITQSIIAKGWFYFSIRNVSLRKVEDLWNAFLCQQTLLCWKLFIGDYKVEIVYKHHQTLVGNGNFQVYWQTPNNNIPVLWNYHYPSAHGLLTATGKIYHAGVSLNWLNKYISLW